jgi:hypothetical protein
MTYSRSYLQVYSRSWRLSIHDYTLHLYQVNYLVNFNYTYNYTHCKSV